MPTESLQSVPQRWWRKALDWVRRDVFGEPAQAWRLQSFRARFNELAHGIYVELLVGEIDGREDPPRNIAVSGPYGSGKSSVLSELRRRLPRDSVVEIELATVDRDTSAIVRPARAGTSGRAVTEALQKEVVKRLLYAAKPSRLPRSQLNRIRPFSARRTVWISVVVALGYLVAEWVYSIPGPAIKWAGTWTTPPADISPEAWGSFARVFDALIVFGLLVAIQWALSLVRIREVSVGEFKLAREDSAQNPFDQYLDEIVYFFQSTKYDLVVIEDLDRFENPDIFVTLREINAKRKRIVSKDVVAAAG